MSNMEEEIKVILVGESGTGKTSLINATTGIGFNEDIETTTSNTFLTKKITIGSDEITVNLWDTIGQEKFRSLTKIFIKDSKIVIFVYDITRKQTFDELNFWIKMVQDILGNTPILGICGNKDDLIMKEEVKEGVVKKYSEEKNIPYRLTSAKNPLSFNQFLDELVGKYVEKFGGKKNNGEKPKPKINLTNDQKPAKKKCC